MDRASSVPSHQGPLIFPNSTFFTRLLQHARRDRSAVRDVNAGSEKTYGDPLGDALALRAVIEATLSNDVKRQLAEDKEVFVGVLAAGGYEFAVAVTATLALGAAVVPMCKFVEAVATSPEEAEYYVTKSKQVAILSSQAASEKASKIVGAVNNKNGSRVKHVSVLEHLPSKPICSALDMVVSSNRPLDDRSAGVVIFTSGTTGKPKGAVLRRSYTRHTAQAIGEGYDIDHRDVLLHVLPVHHTTGLGTSFFPWLIAGACIEFRSGNFDPEWIWSRWAKGGITVFSGVPTIYMRLKWHFEQNIANRPREERGQFIAAANQLRVLKCGSSALQKDIPSGVDPTTLPAGCVDMVVPGVKVKIGESGELLVKSPFMFSRYLENDEATAEAHDTDGYFKTGDIGCREGHLYFITGRVSVDIIKSGGNYLAQKSSEVVVVGVADEEYGERIAALIVLKDGGSLKLDDMRQDLTGKLAKYKLPTILRLVEDEIPKGVTGKVQKKVLRETLLPSPGWEKDSNVQGRRSRSSGKTASKL
ncbi:hypothetical protein BCR34DRAFT_628990 [Clohesyomyces aquaticus]|uniref:Uncharacterized protein n=1 Tax=Clohesyomyces aquaticus TaxID=1231657 RepID=A0A1Y1YC98_9PLEO|nr:hypothetical protein BCR34DRAFT_628990 [Clohesyomyces aquaticus]